MCIYTHIHIHIYVHIDAYTYTAVAKTTHTPADLVHPPLLRRNENGLLSLPTIHVRPTVDRTTKVDKHGHTQCQRHPTQILKKQACSKPFTPQAYTVHPPTSVADSTPPAPDDRPQPTPAGAHKPTTCPPWDPGPLAPGKRPKMTGSPVTARVPESRHKLRTGFRYVICTNELFE